jgi:hypothetical protein
MRAKNEYKFIKEAYQSVIKEDTSRLAGAQAKKTAGARAARAGRSTLTPAQQEFIKNNPAPTKGEGEGPWLYDYTLQPGWPKSPSTQASQAPGAIAAPGKTAAPAPRPAPPAATAPVAQSPAAPAYEGGGGWGLPSDVDPTRVQAAQPPAAPAQPPAAPAAPARPSKIGQTGDRSPGGTVSRGTPEAPSYWDKDKGLLLSPEAVDNMRKELEAKGLWPPSTERQAWLDSIEPDKPYNWKKILGSSPER